MTIDEPWTALTDGLIAVTALGFAVALRRAGGAAGDMRRFFVAGALAALLGGAWHAVHRALPVLADVLVWKLTMLSAIAATFFLATGAVRAAGGSASWRRALLAKWIVMSLLALAVDQFLLVVIDYGVALLAVSLVSGNIPHGGSRWFRIGVVVSIAGALVQQSTLRAGPLNHNDLFHFVQIAANCLFFVGARKLAFGSEATKPIA